MNDTLATRHAALIERCRIERHELVATTATMLALVPHARDARRWWRAARRLLRIAALLTGRNNTQS